MAFKMKGPWLKSALKHTGNHNGLSEADHAKYSADEKKGRAEYAAKQEKIELKAAQKANEAKIKTLAAGGEGTFSEDAMAPLMAERVRIARILQAGTKWALEPE